MRYLCATRAGGPGWPGTLRDCSGGGWGGSREIRAAAWVGGLPRIEVVGQPCRRFEGGDASSVGSGRAGQAGGGGLPFPTPCRLAGRGTQPATFGRRLGTRQRGISRHAAAGGCRDDTVGDGWRPVLGHPPRPPWVVGALSLSGRVRLSPLRREARSTPCLSPHSGPILRIRLLGSCDSRCFPHPSHRRS